MSQILIIAVNIPTEKNFIVGQNGITEIRKRWIPTEKHGDSTEKTMSLFYRVKSGDEIIADISASSPITIYYGE